MRRALGMVLIAVLVVLAGCSGVLGGGGGEPTETVTPAAVPTDEPTPTPVPRLAPGLTEQGIENASALVAAHASFLQTRSFTRHSNTTALASNGSALLREVSTLHAGQKGEGVRLVWKSNGSYGYPRSEVSPVRTEIWSKSKRLFLKRTYPNGTTTYEQVRADEQYGTGAGRFRYRLEPFGTANTTVTQRFTRNGTTLYRVRGTAQADWRGNTTLRLLVDSRGVIHKYRTARRFPSERNISKITHETRFSGIGTTGAPERPSWVDTAMNRTTSVPENPVTTYP
jgi:hypothetical protein